MLLCTTAPPPYDVLLCTNRLVLHTLRLIPSGQIHKVDHFYTLVGTMAGLSVSFPLSCPCVRASAIYVGSAYMMDLHQSEPVPLLGSILFVHGKQTDKQTDK